MKYAKPSLSFEEQADRLLERGLIADRDLLIHRLCAVSYYRLSGYLYPFRTEGNDHFKAGTELETVWRRYCFDRRLRVLILDAIERTEVAVRTQLIHHFSHSHGPFGYCAHENLPKLKIQAYLEWRLALQMETDRSKEIFKKHFFERYDEDKVLPLWMLAELMSMGSVLTFFRGVSPVIKRAVAEQFGYPDELFGSWLRSLNAARNICAHHSRFWNRTMGYPPMLPRAKKHPRWRFDHPIRNDRCGVLLFICRDLLSQISPTSQWHQRIEALILEYPEIPIQSIGLLEGWREHPIWKRCV